MYQQRLSECINVEDNAMFFWMISDKFPLLFVFLLKWESVCLWIESAHVGLSSKLKCYLFLKRAVSKCMIYS